MRTSKKRRPNGAQPLKWIIFGAFGVLGVTAVLCGWLLPEFLDSRGTSQSRFVYESSGRKSLLAEIATENLSTAVNLPGAEGLDVAKSAQILDQWSDRVRQETSRHLYRFRATPSEF